MMGDPKRGLYNKFIVTRTDGQSEPGQHHHGCEYFVLDLDHDPHAKAALAAYARSCATPARGRTAFPMLALDLREKLKMKGFGKSASAYERTAAGTEDEQEQSQSKGKI